jgi:hypothetical protein
MPTPFVCWFAHVISCQRRHGRSLSGIAGGRTLDAPAGHNAPPA